MKKVKKVSYFVSLDRKEDDRELQDILSSIKNGTLQKDLILEIRDQKAKDEDYSRNKRQLASFTPSGTFHTTHKVTDLKEYSNLIVLDIDNLGVRKVLQIKKGAIECLYSLAVFISPSGTGLKILVMIDTDSDMHGVAFEQVKNFYENFLKVEIDPSGKDVSRLCFVSYDPELHYNNEANVFMVLDKFYADYKSAVTSTKGKFQYVERQRNHFVHFLANNCNRLGIPEKVAENLILKDYNYDQKEVMATIKSAYSNTSESKKTKDSKWDKLESFLKRNYDFLFNEFTGAVEFRKRPQKKFSPLTDYDGNSILRNLKKDGHVVSKDAVYTIMHSDFTPKYHPIREYVESLEVWDGETDYINQLAKRFSTDDNQFFRDAFKRWFVAMVACGLHDRIINQTALIFTGKQGIGKSTFFRNLLPEPLRKYRYAGMIDPKNKDTLIYLTQCLIIDMDELSSLSRKGNNEVKELITKDRILLRRPFGRNSEDIPRRASFVGSINEQEFLTDTTGNRRFLCFSVDSIDYKSPINYEGIYAQAKALFEDKFKYYFDGEEIEELNRRNEKFRQKSVIEDLISANYKPASDMRNAQLYLNAGEFLVMLRKECGVSLDATNSIQLGKALIKLGFTKVKKSGRMVYAIDLIDGDQAEMRIAS